MRTRASLLLTGALAVVCAARAAFAQPDPAVTPAPNAEQILGRARAAFRAHARPAFVDYVIERHDRIDGLTDLENSYTLHIWCRASDRAALARRVFRGRVTAGATFIHPAFDGAIDPGPPTADIFEPRVFAAATSSPPPQTAATAVPVIGVIRATIELEYRAELRGIDDGAYHLVLSPRRDPARNRIRDLYIDTATYDVRRMTVHDHLYAGFSAYPELFDVRFVTRDGVPMIASIHGAGEDNPRTNAPYIAHEVDYVYRDVRFVETMPAWYFEPATYGAHASELPE